MTEQSLEEKIRQQLKRSAWKLQYEAKKKYRMEIQFTNEKWDIGHTEEVDSQMFVEELLNSLPERERFIIKQVVIEGRSEREVAKRLELSPSRLHACKVQALQRLRSKLILA